MQAKRSLMQTHASKTQQGLVQHCMFHVGEIVGLFSSPGSNMLIAKTDLKHVWIIVTVITTFNHVLHFLSLQCSLQARRASWPDVIAGNACQEGDQN